MYKAVKNETELQHIRIAHLKDAAALVRERDTLKE
jgi:Xaa-Pro aminopeptidase